MSTFLKSLLLTACMSLFFIDSHVYAEDATCQREIGAEYEKAPYDPMASLTTRLDTIEQTLSVLLSCMRKNESETEYQVEPSKDGQVSEDEYNRLVKQYNALVTEFNNRLKVLEQNRYSSQNTGDDYEAM